MVCRGYGVHTIWYIKNIVRVGYGICTIWYTYMQYDVYMQYGISTAWYI